METYNYPWDIPVTAKITSLLRLAMLLAAMHNLEM